MNVLGLFSGTGGFELGLQNVGMNISGLCEIEPHCIKLLNKNFPHVKVVPDIVTYHPEINQFDVMCGGFPCFTEDAYVLTYRGYIPINTVVVGDLVLTHQGRWKPVTKVMQKENAKLRNINGAGILSTYTTDEHPYYVRDMAMVWDNTRGARGMNVRKFSQPSWVNASELTTSHYASQILPDIVDDTRTNEWWWLVGRYIADGWKVDRKDRNNGRVVICCSHAEADELAQRISAAGFNASECKERTVYKFHITKGCFYEDLADFGRLAHGKTIPGWVFSLPQDKMRSLVDGYISGDGSINKITGTIRCSTVSKSLALGMALLIQRSHGKIAGLYESTRKQNHTIEGRVVNQRKSYQVHIHGTSRSSFIENGYGWKKIKLNKEIETCDTVYNLSVEDDESYMVNGSIVHNCTDISIAGKNAGLLGGTKSILWQQYHRVIKEGRPTYAIIENVNAILGRGLEVILQDLAEIGYDTAYTTFDSKYFGVPQRRRRVYIVAFRDGIATNTDFFQLGERDSAEHVAKMELVDKSFEWDFTQVGRVQYPFAFFTRQRSDEFGCKGVSSALMKRDYKDFTDLVVQNGNVRRVTPTERLLLQGYPIDWFDGCGLTTTQQYTCNGMTIPVVEHIGKLLLDYHEKNV